MFDVPSFVTFTKNEKTIKYVKIQQLIITFFSSWNLCFCLKVMNITLNTFTNMIASKLFTIDFKIEKLKAKNILLNALKKLEYRGYHSAGVAIYDEDSFKVLHLITHSLSACIPYPYWNLSVFCLTFLYTCFF